MHGRFKSEKLAKYPHMKPEDVAVWERFIKARPDAYDTVDYDFAVGLGAEIPQGTQENIARDFTLLTQKKIDVVGYAGDTVDILEVKPEADMRALGQLRAYADLYLDDHPEQSKIKMVVIAGAIDRDMQRVFGKNNVSVVVV